MRNFLWSFLMFFCLISVSFSQTKGIETGSYLSTNKGQKIRLNLLDDNKYELVFYSGDYKVKGDSLIFTQTAKSGAAFDVAFKNDKKAEKVKVTFLDPSYFTFYIGTQNGTEPVQYQKITDIRSKVDPDWVKTDLEFEIDHVDYLYLVYEDYQGESKISKYALPKDVSEATIKYELDALGDLNISGYLDRKTNQLMISEQTGKNPIAFVSAKDVQPDAISKVIPLENKTVSSFTYPGKDALADNGFGTEVSVDTAYAGAVATPKIDFKFKIENDLKKAIAATSASKSKFLVVAVDGKNPSAKADFDTFIKDQETQVGYNMYEVYDPQYDLFNYYLATANDKKWLKTNKIQDNPSLVVLNGDGVILATSKSKLADKQYQFNYYDGFSKKLKRVNAFYDFNKVLNNKKVTDANLILAFNKVSSLEIPYDYETTENDTIDFKLTKVVTDQKAVDQSWKKLIEVHQKDTKPNMYLVETILKEIKNQGFSKQFLSEDRVLNDTDFLAIDYLIKQYDAIEAERIAFNNIEGEVHAIGSLNTEITSALQQNKYLAEEKGSVDGNQSKIISVYKKLIAGGKANYDCYQNYFAYLGEAEEKDGSNTTYLKEFSSYFNTHLTAGKESVIEQLDAMYSTLGTDSDYQYDNGWKAFKEYHSNLSNSAAWTVVLKPQNSNFLKSAITWSEYSLVVSKNNPYYLDTLAQLYYKDDQKQKAIETQTLAVKYLTAEVEEETATEIKETLTKMQNGTY
ncbi:hypothetical protein C8C83_1338 [Flavobacterium sp. 90]|uniref:hypothetical protein n=1 Tax=unclassified Flavobacterium TaxID=196869 RepID=UPI000EAE9B1A|nr:MULTISPECIES: hypothetical protein [unclassified Flavobacterium]RKR09691.1 hypothetical protein C8C82_1639 [Flavobacterium sp. 81]TCK53477.1 hypothetical protein C8C83_1338 [Flavobacterium sp. 90]